MSKKNYPRRTDALAQADQRDARANARRETLARKRARALKYNAPRKVGR